MVKNKKAFSLIELSIVLIIMGFLIAGVLGGVNLIFSAKTQKAITKINEWKRTTGLFDLVKNRLPGDLNGSGYVGVSGQGYRTGSFGGKYSNLKVSSLAGPFVDLFLSNSIDFEPKNVTANIDLLQIVPSFVTEGDGIYYETLVPSSSIETQRKNSKYFRYKMDYGVYFTLFSRLSATTSRAGESFIVDPKFIQKFDKKIDDGVWNGGAVRVVCSQGGRYMGSVTIEQALSNTNKFSCHYIQIKVDDYK